MNNKHNLIERPGVVALVPVKEPELKVVERPHHQPRPDGRLATGCPDCARLWPNECEKCFDWE